MTFISTLIPQKLRNNHKVRRSALLIVIVDLCILLFSLILAAFFIYIDFSVGMYTMLFSALCATLFPILLYKTSNLDLAGHFFSFASLTVFTSLCIGSGSINSPFLIWFLSIPPIGYFYMKKKQAKLWSSLTIVTVIALFINSISGLFIVQQLGDSWTPYVTAFNFFMLLALYLTVIRSFNTGFKKMNTRLESSNDRIKQSNEELERFAYIASHDLKSPLRIITSFISLFKNHYDGGSALDKVGQEYLSFIDRSAKQMSHLIEDILEYSRTSNRKISLELIDLNEMLFQIVHQLQLDGIYDTSNIKYQTLPSIYSDNTQMHQLFQNLIENGLKYNKSEFPSIDVSFSEIADEKYHFVIKDNGIGIDPKFNQQIFEMFKRLHTKDKYEGTGIGLAICKKIVDAFNGEIWLESEIGKGSVFNIILPKGKKTETTGPIEKKAVLFEEAAPI